LSSGFRKTNWYTRRQRFDASIKSHSPGRNAAFARLNREATERLSLPDL
jgi:hypothetical protein